MPATTLPYSVSTGSAFAAFDKLQGAKNYISWKKDMSTVLEALQQWEVVTGAEKAPVPADASKPTEEETAAIKAFGVRKVSTFMEISFRIADSAKIVLGDTKDPKLAWELLEKRFGVKQQGLKSVLMSKIQLTKWDGSRTIYTHRDYMVDLRSQLLGAGTKLDDETFYEHFTNSLPRSLDLFISIYEDDTYDVERLCNKFAKYEMRCVHANLTEGKDVGTSDGSVAMFGQTSTSKEKAKKEKGKGKGRDYQNVTCFNCGKKGHIKSKCPDKPKEKAKEEKSGEKSDDKSKSSKGTEDTNKAKPASGTLYQAVTLGAQASSGDSDGTFYVDSGASDHLIPSRGDLHAYRKFDKPVEISAANGGRIFAYGSGTLRVATTANGLEQEAELQDVYYTPGVHVRLVSLGKLEGQGWDIRLCDGRMELRDRSENLFADIQKANNVYPAKLKVIPPRTGLAAWTMEGDEDATHDELGERLATVAMVATVKGADGTRASLMTWHQRLGHPSFKTVVALAESGADGMIITDLPMKTPGLDACAACVAAKSVHLPHRDGRNRAETYLDRVHIDIAGPMQVKSASGKEYAYILIDDQTRVVYMRPLRHKSDTLEAFRIFKAAAENESQRKICEVMTDNARELCMGEMKTICEESGIQLNTSVRYSPESNGVAERTIGVLTGAVRAMLHDSGLPKFLWAEAFSAVTYVSLLLRLPTNSPITDFDEVCSD
jgi:hypothetical protein